jgi:hypothetical protein
MLNGKRTKVKRVEPLVLGSDGENHYILWFYSKAFNADSISLSLASYGSPR